MRLDSLSCEFGEVERTLDSIADLERLRTERKIPLPLPAMGCGTFSQMLRSLPEAARACIQRSLDQSGVPAERVNHIIFATSDNHLLQIDPDFSRKILVDLRLDHAVPALISLQQCASSLTALDYARRLLEDETVENVLLVAFDLVASDEDRVQSFALFGDAIASCLISRSGPGLALDGFCIGIDELGIRGSDSFESRKRVATAVLCAALSQADTDIELVRTCFSTNFYKPVALFNASICGIPAAKLAIPTLARRAHCGNCDWLINLAEHSQTQGLQAGGKYLAQAFAPGFNACAVMTAVD